MFCYSAYLLIFFNVSILLCWLVHDSIFLSVFWIIVTHLNAHILWYLQTISTGTLFQRIIRRSIIGNKIGGSFKYFLIFHITVARKLLVENILSRIRMFSLVFFLTYEVNVYAVGVLGFCCWVLLPCSWKFKQTEKNVVLYQFCNIGMYLMWMTIKFLLSGNLYIIHGQVQYYGKPV